MNKTTNYQLNQWERADRVLMEDFNSDNAKIDAALGTLAGRAQSLESTLSGKADTSALTALQSTVNTKADKTALTSLQSTVSGVSDRAGSAFIATGRLSTAADSFALNISGVDWSKYSAARLVGIH